MKSLKKSLVTLLACTMAIAPCMVGNMPVSAAEGDTYSITVTKGDDAVHTYEAYQVFDGDLTDDGILSNIVWGKGVNGAALLTALQNTQNEYLKDKFTTCTSAKDVAGVLEAKMKDEDDDVDFNRAFADVVGSNLSGTKTTSDESGKMADLDAGYYLVKDQENTLGGEHAAYTQFILRLTDNETVEAKSVLPTLDKVINEGSGVTANTASIGDDVEFKLTSKVPDMTGYNKYFFVVNDKLSEGFTFDIKSVAIKIGGTTLTAPVYDDPETEGVNEATDGAYYVVDDGNGNIKIVIRNFISYQPQKNQTIEITYSAELDSDADLGTDGNTNIANLVYSNNPNFEYTGNVDDDPATPDYPDEPNPGTPPNDGGTPDDPSDDTPGTPGEPTGDTPEITTVTYATTLQITKVDGDNTNTKLPGAKFKLEKKNSEGTYVQVGTDEMTTDADGLAAFAGLGAGEYRITETQAPTGGYNLLDAPIEFKLTAEAEIDSITWEGNNGVSFDATNKILTIQIGNYKGSSLPTTGGMGTTLIYVLGGMLVLCSIVLIITRKRMEYRQF